MFSMCCISIICCMSCMCSMYSMLRHPSASVVTIDVTYIARRCLYLFHLLNH